MKEAVNAFKQEAILLAGLQHPKQSDSRQLPERKGVDDLISAI
jgi:hypothetical protein